MKIDIYQDTVCPWCRIGKHNLKVALAHWDGEPVTIAYHPFFLNPDTPPEGFPFRAYMQAKIGGQTPVEELFAGPREAGKRVGLTFNFDRIEMAPNTLLSHALIALAPADKCEAVIDAIYDAYFEDGRNIGDLDTLIAIAKEQGLDPVTTRAGLNDPEVRAQVTAAIDEAAALGINGVPFFVINERYAFSGGQPPEAFLHLLQQVLVLQTQASENAATR